MHIEMHIPSSLPPAPWSPKIILFITTIDIDDKPTASNTAPTSIFAVTNSAATLPNYHAPDTAQIMIAHPLIAKPLIVLPMMVQPGAASDGAAFNGTTCDGNAHHGAA